MSERRRPTLADFGLTEADVERCAERVRRRENAGIWIALFLPIPGWCLGLLWNVDVLGLGFRDFVLLLVGGSFVLFGFSLMTSFLTVVPIQFVMRLVMPDLPFAPRVAEYKAAVKGFDEWWARTQSEFWRSLSGLAFEGELAALFNRIGWKASPTVASGDRGIDVELYRGGTRTIVQCKAHAKPVGPAAVRELYGALAASGAGSAMLASLSGFSPGARDFARQHGIELIDLDWILTCQRKLEVSGGNPGTLV